MLTNSVNEKLVPDDNGMGFYTISNYPGRSPFDGTATLFAAKEIFSMIHHGNHIAPVTFSNNEIIFKSPREKTIRYAAMNVEVGKRLLITDSTINGLILKGANVQSCNELLLRWACSKNKLDWVKIAIHAGADITVRNDTPMQIAINAGNLALQKLLQSVYDNTFFEVKTPLVSQMSFL